MLDIESCYVERGMGIVDMPKSSSSVLVSVILARLRYCNELLVSLPHIPSLLSRAHHEVMSAVVSKSKALHYVYNPVSTSIVQIVSTVVKHG